MPPAEHAPARLVPSTDGVTIAVHDLGGDGPPVLFCHPTGFLGMTWAPLAAELAGAAHAWALDFRGHGDSGSPDSGDFAWSGMADDVLAVVDDLGLSDVRAAGHSMGGAALLMAEQRRPGTFARIWAFEPIVFPPPEGGALPPSAGGAAPPNPLAAGARRRRPWFPDREAAYANFAAKPPMSSLTPAALRAYVDHGLRDRVDGTGDDGGDGDGDGDGVELKCTPEVEARVFEGAAHHTTFARLNEVRCPVTVAVSGDAAGPAQVGPLVVERLPQGTLERHPTLTHFGPMEDPAGMAAAVRVALHLG
jgi:pimeloyl-ACP methyl ester carboxylesterase